MITWIKSCFKSALGSLSFLKQHIGESHREDIDGLRGIAVLSVVIFHAFPKLCKGGFVGVDIFFVISGYLITSIILKNVQRNTFSLSNFYARRIRRIFPALALVLGTCLAFGWFALLPDEYHQLGKHKAGGAGFISNFVLASEAGYFDNASDTKPLLHLWSLGIEEQFYFIWPLLVWAFWKKRFDGFVAGLVIATASFVASIMTLKSAPTTTFYFPFTRFWELLIGSLLAYAHTTKSPVYEKLVLGFHSLIRVSKINTVKSILGLILITLGVFLLKERTPFPGFAALLPTLGSVLLISAGTDAWGNRKILSNNFLVWFGAISYPLYLWHWPLLSFARIMESETPIFYIRTIAVFLSIVLAWLTTVYIERWFRFGEARNYKVAIPTIAVFGIGLVGFWVNYNKGFQNRFQKLVEMNHQLIRTPQTNDACLKFFKNNSPPFPYCKFEGDIDSKKEIVALIGDSHAHVLFPGLAETLKNKGKDTILLANSGCPPLKGLLQSGTEDDLSACDERIKSILNHITQDPQLSPRIKTVIITTRGSGYISKHGFGIEGNEPWLVKFSNPSFNKIPPADAFAQGLAETSKELIKAGKKVFYVMENPELGFDVRSCIQRPITLSNKNAQCSIPLETVLERQKDYRIALSKISIQGLTLIDPVPQHCPNKICTPIINGSLLYADDDHWSIAGSFFISKNLISKYL